MLRWVQLVLLLATTAHALSGQVRTVRVGMLREISFRQVMIMPTGKDMTVLVDGRSKGRLVVNDGMKVQCGAKGMHARSLGGAFHAARSIVLQGDGFRIRSLDKKMVERQYPGSVELRPTPTGFQVVGVMPLEDYVAGVIQSEAGRGRELEYYKLQAVSCRTYALASVRRHAAEGYEVCDQTHCQVFHGRNRQELITKAVQATHDMVAVDANIRLIHSTFHSNCGGQTLNAEDLWSKSEPYLIGTTDTFCLNEPHATWRKEVPRTEWLNYLRRTYKVNTADPAVADVVSNYDPPCRDVYMRGVVPPVKLGQVRVDMGFNSTFFRSHVEGDRVVFEGRGFGHGIGLCQEGAMRMAQLGYRYTDILHHYYTDVHLVDLRTIDFFRDDDL